MRTRTLQSCYVLHRRPYRESSLLVELFTREAGRIGLVARGTRQVRVGRPGCAFQPFQPLLVSWSGRTDLKNLTYVETAGPVVLHPARIFLAGLYLNELLLALLQHQDPHPALYDAYHDTLKALTSGVERSLRIFEMLLLSELGYGLVLDQDWRTGEPVRADRDYYYKAEQGPSLEDPGGERLRVRGTVLLGLSAGRPAAPGEEDERCRLLRHNLRYHLGGRELASRAAYRELLRLGSAREGISVSGAAP